MIYFSAKFSDWVNDKSVNSKLTVTQFRESAFFLCNDSLVGIASMIKKALELCNFFLQAAVLDIFHSSDNAIPKSLLSAA